MSQELSHNVSSTPNTSNSSFQTPTTPPPPYTARDARIAACIRRPGAAPRLYVPNAVGVAQPMATAALSPSAVQAGSRKPKRAFVAKLTCAMLVIALLVSCAAFVMALVTLMATKSSRNGSSIAATETTSRADSNDGDTAKFADMEERIFEAKDALRSLEYRGKEWEKKIKAIGGEVEEGKGSVVEVRDLVDDAKTAWGVWQMEYQSKVLALEGRVGDMETEMHDLKEENEELRNHIQLVRTEVKKYQVAINSKLSRALKDTKIECGDVCSFEIYTSLATDGAYDLETFSIEGNHYLAVASYGDISKARHRTMSTLYKYDGIDFEVYQTFLTYGAYDMEAFVVKENHFLAVANYWNGKTYNLNSAINQWNGTHFAPFQMIETHGATAVESFSINESHYLAFTNEFDEKTFSLPVKILKWDGSYFVPFQSLPASGANDVKFFTIRNQPYLVVANYRSIGSQFNINSYVYHWSGFKFERHQTIQTVGARGVHVFSVGKKYFMAFANFFDGRTRETNSVIYKWNFDFNRFDEFQIIPTKGASKWTSAEIDGKHYLFVANYRLQNQFTVDSVMYQWKRNTFVPVEQFPAKGARILKPFKMGYHTFLGVAYSFDGTKSRISSPIYRWQ